MELVIHEGRNRIVRRLLDQVGHPVTKLSRTQFGPVSLGSLPTGETRELTLDELGELLEAASALSRRAYRGRMVRLGPQPVPELLRPYVASLVAYDVDLGGPGVHRGLPGTSLTFVLPLDAPLDVSWAADPGSRRAAGPASRDCTPHRRRSTTTATRPASSWPSRSTAPRALLGLPAAELAGELTDLAEAVPELADLPERLLALADWEARIQLVWARARLGAAAQRPGRTAGRGRPGAGPAHPRRRGGGGGRRGRLQPPAPGQPAARRGRAGTEGVPAGGPVRAQPIPARRCRDRRASVTGGRRRPGRYADQAHLTREWVRLAGCPPTTWMAEELPFVQDRDPDERPS